MLGFDTAWVAQHHAHIDGGLPAPLVFLTMAAARTSRIVLATGIITLPLEKPVRLAEDAAVLSMLSGGRFELGFGSGGNAVVFSLFGQQLDQRQHVYDRAFATVRDVLRGNSLTPDGRPLFPTAPELVSSMWEATMSLSSAERAGEHGSRLLLARTAVRDAKTEGLALGEAQTPLVEAYLAHFTGHERAPRIGLSRSIYVAPTRARRCRRRARYAPPRAGAGADAPATRRRAVSRSCWLDRTSTSGRRTRWSPASRRTCCSPAPPT